MIKKLSFAAILSLTFATIQAQGPLVHLKFENNLTNEGSHPVTFQVDGNNSSGVVVPYGFGSLAHEGNYAVNFSAIGDDTDVSYSLIQNGAASYDAEIQSSAGIGIAGSAARTISAWIRYDDRNPDTNGSHTIVNMGDPSSPALGRTTFTFAAANNEIQLGVSGGNVKHYYNNGESVEDGNWHQVAFTYPAGGTLADVVYYIDGVAVTDDDAGANSTKVLETTDEVFYIGSNGKNGTKWFDGGGIDDLRIYDYDLTAAQIATIYNGGSLSSADIGFAENELKVSSTLVDDVLKVETSSGASLEINVIDITGNVVIRTGGTSVNMSSLASGVYIVKVREDNKVENIKVIKK